MADNSLRRTCWALQCSESSLKSKVERLARLSAGAARQETLLAGFDGV